MKNLSCAVLLGWVILIALAGLASAAPPAEPAKVEVPNGSFEEVSPENGLPAGWGLLGQGDPVRMDEEVACDGRRSLKVTLRGGGAGATVVGMIKVQPERACVYRVSVRVRTFDFNGTASLFVSPYPLPSQAQFSPEKLTGTQDWRPLTVDVPVDPKVNALQLRLITAGSLGQVWWDQVEITVREARP